MKTFFYFFRGLFAITCLSSAFVLAQVESGQIAGAVADQSGAVIPGATVTVTNVATGAARTTQTSGAGGYLVSGLEPATYEVQVTSGAFRPFKAIAEVTVGGHTTVDAKLSVNSEITEVQVVGEGGVAVNTQSQELSQVIDTNQLAHLPSLTRNPYDFVLLSGNVSNGDNTTNSMSSEQNVASQGVGVAMNGQREAGTEILLDGAENVGVFSVTVGNQTPIDSVQEYSVVTNNFSAEYGRASGGVVNLSTKSGTNQIHGSAWEFNRLSAYTANTYANDAANQAAGSIVAPKGAYTRNVFGFGAGGPIMKNKLFLYESTEWTRVRSSASETQEILDPSFINLLPANTQAYFKQYGTGAAAASGTVVTAGQLANAGLNTIGPINGVTPVSPGQPVFDVINFKVPFDAGGDFPQNSYSLVGRVDFNPTDKTTMFFRAARQNQDLFNGSNTYSAYPQYNTGTTNVNSSYLFSLAHVFNAGLLNSAKISYSRFNNQTSFDTSLLNTPNLMITPPSDPVTSVNIQLPGLQNAGSPGVGGLPFGGPQNTIQPQDDLTWNKGRHAMRFGGQLTYIQLNVAYGAYAQAVEQLGHTIQDSFSDLTNSAGNPNGSQLVQFEARVDPQDKLPCALDIYGNQTTGASCAVTPPLQSAVYGRSYRYKDWATYAQDSFRVFPRLTLNYGVRYEHYGVQHNNKPQLDSNFYFGPGSSIAQQVRTGGVQIANQSSIGQFWAPSWGTVAPRIGFAFDPVGDGKSSIRAGYGISYERNFGNVTYNASFNPPASAVVASNCGPASATCGTVVTNNNLGPLGLPGPTTYLGPVELRMPDPNIKTAQTQFWSLALQRSVLRNTVVEVSYSGAKGTHLYDIENINEVGAAQYHLGDPLVQGAACVNTGYSNQATGTPICPTRPNQQYAAINMRGSLGSSSYNALNIKFQTQNLHNTGLSLITNYTWSHAFDDLSQTFGGDGQGGSAFVGSLGYTDYTQPGLDWGSSDFNVGNRIVVSPIWETPWFKSGNLLGREALGGWNLSGIITARTGTPFSVFDYTNDLIGFTVPRLTPATPITNKKTAKSPQVAGPNLFNGLTFPLPASFAPLNSELGYSDLGPFPGNMSRRNTFTGPGAWNSDLAASKTFKVTERVGLEFRAEGFDVFNHHNYYVNEGNLAYSGARDYENKQPRTSDSGEPSDPHEPRKVVLQLEATPDGCRWLLDRWFEIRKPLENESEDGSGWLSCQKLTAIRLLGKQPLDAICDPEVAMVFLASYAIWPNLATAFHELRCEIHYDQVENFEAELYRDEWQAITPADSAAGRKALLEIVDKAIDRLLRLEAERREVADFLEEVQSNIPSDGESKSIEQIQRHRDSANRLMLRNIDAIERARRKEAEGWGKVRQERDRLRAAARRGHMEDERFVADERRTVRDAQGYDVDLEAGLALWKATHGRQPGEDPYRPAPGAGGGTYARGTPNDAGNGPGDFVPLTLTEQRPATNLQNEIDGWGRCDQGGGQRAEDGMDPERSTEAGFESKTGDVEVSGLVPVSLMGEGPATKIQNEIRRGIAEPCDLRDGGQPAGGGDLCRTAEESCGRGNGGDPLGSRDAPNRRWGGDLRSAGAGLCLSLKPYGAKASDENTKRTWAWWSSGNCQAKA